MDGSEVNNFVVAGSYIIGVGDTIDELQASGEWLAAERTMEINP